MTPDTPLLSQCGQAGEPIHPSTTRVFDADGVICGIACSVTDAEPDTEPVSLTELEGEYLLLTDTDDVDLPKLEVLPVDDTDPEIVIEPVDELDTLVMVVVVVLAVTDTDTTAVSDTACV
jgi:hypothetical protein